MTRDVEATDRAAIYALAGEMPDGSFIVKIGMTSHPYDRYSSLITGMPFPSAMRWSWVGMRSVVYVVETKIHQLFADRNTAREWFHFQRDEKEVLWDGMTAAIFACTEALPDWNGITEEQVMAWQVSRRQPRPRGEKSFREFDFRNRLARHEKVF